MYRGESTRIREAWDAKCSLDQHGPSDRVFVKNLMQEEIPGVSVFVFWKILRPEEALGRLFWKYAWHIVENHMRKVANMSEAELLEYVRCLKIRFKAGE